MIIVQTPLRISFLGGGTDIEEFYKENGGGAVLSTSIDKHVYVIVKERFDDMIYLNYSRKEIVDNIENIQHDLIREAMRITGVHSGIEITTLADIPTEGTGLGSSSSITVGLLQALHAFQGVSVSAEYLADMACQIEIDILGNPIGSQDQYIAAYGNMRFTRFQFRSISTQRLDISVEDKRTLNENLLLFYTGKTRKAADILTEQKACIDERRYVLQELAKLAYVGRNHLAAGLLDQFGELLDTGWKLKKQLASGVSSPEIDEVYQAGIRAGALGGKITGAGGGGFMLFYCPAGKREALRRELSSLKELAFSFHGDGSKVIFNYRN